MPFQPGKSGNPTGRVKGQPNRVTKDVREAIRSFVETYAEKLPGWIDKVAEDDPARAAALVLQASEYVLPKLGRSELTGPDGRPLGPAVPVLNVMMVGDASPDAIDLTPDAG